MADRYLYLLLDVAAISVPFAFSFYRKARFADTYRRIIPAILIPLIPFVIWDAFFTDWGHWGFNDRYLVGWKIVGLPIEEWLFFICIPYACLFTYFAFKYLRPVQWPNFRYVSYLLAAGVIAMALFNSDKDYTFVTGLSLGIFLLLLSYLRKPYLAQFFLSYLIILIPFFLINGVLTGSWIEQEVVWYNNAENLSMRLGTIPVEDPFYGMLLLLMNVVVWEELAPKSKA